jgi:hypothetical protein
MAEIRAMSEIRAITVLQEFGKNKQHNLSLVISQRREVFNLEPMTSRRTLNSLQNLSLVVLSGPAPAC